MKKILILANNDVGLYKFRKELIAQMVKDNEVYISLPYGKFVPKLMELGCKFIDTPISRRGTNPITDFKLLMSYKKIIKEIKPQVVLTYTIKPNIYGGLACRLSKTPYLSNITGLGTAVENRGLLQKITLFLYRTALKKVNCVFFQNEENKELFRDEGLINGEYRLIPGSGVNLDYYSVLDYPSDNLINFVFIARVMKEKGIDQYLDAAEYIRGKYPKTVFHILGFCEDAYDSKLKELQGRGIIQYHGMQNDIRKFHEISHCTIHPTYYPEGMSNVLLESAASGRPIITTNRSGCREIVDDEINGYVVKQQDSQDLIEKIEKFIALDYEKKKKMGLEGRKKVEKEFDRQIVIDAYFNELQKIKTIL
ncbi:glycosyl transferase [Bacillus sp. L_1B0_8]|uniref:glycosyltransferase family 4 protein n=1 Tax=unclassified Bacillus (in: firmicutes) TaxID=185979 RepID=UPI0005B6CE0F|nr:MULTISPECIES: glycosyltransferase family 4 protein [unclassified Bacillus (in: firmicutes)]KIQ89058.1 glycosyl transferase [Bacillus sp. L_1B0_5]KIQ92644.1 glycosyl transferase [Bacillus sp. L_1B0_8]